MSKSIAIVNVGTDGFLEWIIKTNTAIDFIRTEAVSANATGAVTNGIGFVNGVFGANSLVATTITGGNSSALGTLAIEANTYEAFEYVIVGANVGVNLSHFWVGNSTVNLTANSSTLATTNVHASRIVANTDISIGNSTVNTYINSSSITVNVANFTSATISNLTITGVATDIGTFSNRINVGSNVWLNTSTLFLGNSTVNLVINSTGITGSFSLGSDILSANVLNAASLMLVGANVHANTTAYKVGNSTANVVITSSAILGGANATLNAIVAQSLSAPTVGAGANVVMTTGGFFVGNSTVNVTITSSAITGTPNAQLNVANATIVNATTRVSVGANVLMNSTHFVVGNTTLYTVVTQTGIYGSSGTTAALDVVNAGIVNVVSILGVGANVGMNVTHHWVGNSTVNATINSSTLTVPSIVTTTLALTTLNVATVNATTLVGVGANVGMNLTHHYVGNSTVNVVISSAGITGGPNAAMNVVNAVSVNVGANVRANATTISVGNSTVHTNITSSAITGTSNIVMNVISGNIFYAGQQFSVGNSFFNGTAFGMGFSETTNLSMTTSSISIKNSTSNTALTIPTTVQRSGDYFLHANGSWVEVAASIPSALVSDTFIANTSLRVGSGTANLSVNSTVILYANSTVAARFVVAANGNIGVANAAPTERLHVTGNVYATGELIAASDIVFKENIEYLTNALPVVMKLKGTKYHMKDDTKKRRRKRYGLIAQEVEKIVPELVTGKNGAKGISYNGLIPILVEAIKELSLQVDELKNERKSK